MFKVIGVNRAENDSVEVVGTQIATMEAARKLALENRDRFGYMEVRDENESCIQRITKTTRRSA